VKRSLAKPVILEHGGKRGWERGGLPSGAGGEPKKKGLGKLRVMKGLEGGAEKKSNTFNRERGWGPSTLTVISKRRREKDGLPGAGPHLRKGKKRG